MVATAGDLWTLAPTLVTLFEETDALFPERSTASDGSIGDPSHAARASDHNPAAPRPPGYVYAGDLTDDDLHGCDVTRLAGHLVKTRDRRVKYLIHKGKVVRSYDKPGIPAWVWAPYTGPNAHLHHLHVSVNDFARNDTRPWWPTAKPLPPTVEEIEMMIVTCKGQPTRLLAPPLCPVIDGPTVANIQAKGIPTVEWERDDYDALLSHVVDALGR